MYRNSHRHYLHTQYYDDDGRVGAHLPCPATCALSRGAWNELISAVSGAVPAAVDPRAAPDCQGNVRGN